MCGYYELHLLLMIITVLGTEIYNLKNNFISLHYNIFFYVFQTLMMTLKGRCFVDVWMEYDSTLGDCFDIYLTIVFTDNCSGFLIFIKFCTAFTVPLLFPYQLFNNSLLLIPFILKQFLFSKKSSIQ